MPADSPMLPPDDEPLIEELRALMQADEDDEAVYGWMVEEFGDEAD